MSDVGPDADADGPSKDPIVVRTDYDWSATAPSTAIVEAIAAAEDVDPVALATDEGTPLYEHVDPDALDALVTDQRANRVAMSLTIDGYTVRIADTELIVEASDPGHGGGV